MPQFDIELHGIAAQVNVAVFQAHLFIRQNRFAGQEWRRLRFVQKTELFNDELDFAGGNVLIHGVAVTLFDCADDGDDVFVSQLLGFVVG